MTPMGSSRRLPHVAMMALVLAMGACSSGERTTEPMETVDVEEPTAPEATADRVTTRTSEWDVAGIVRGRTETTTSVPAPPVVVEPPAPPEPVRPQSGVLTAGDVDDLLNPAQYAAYAGRFLQQSGAGLPFVDPRTRVAIRVVDAGGKPVPFARVAIRREGAPLALVTTADGTASFYPRADRVPAQTVAQVTSAAGNASRAIAPGNARAVEIALPGRAVAPQAMDLALVIDTTGSMGDEMAYLRAELDTIVARLKRNAGQIDLRIGVILYRDEGDDYVVRSAPLTADIASVRGLLARQGADGGGDQPEAMDQALLAAGRLQWRTDAAKALLLVTDAPPHEESVAATIAAAQQLRSQGVQIVPVAASGVEDSAQYVLRTAAVLTQGRYIFLTDDSGVGDAHAEPDVACYRVTRLDQLVARVLAGIATGKRIEARPADVVRTVGRYRDGRCAPAGQGQ